MMLYAFVYYSDRFIFTMFTHTISLLDQKTIYNHQNDRKLYNQQKRSSYIFPGHFNGCKLSYDLIKIQCVQTLSPVRKAQ